MWQPIETAPKDGTPVLIFMHGEMTVVHWEDLAHLGPEYADGTGWWDTCANRRGSEDNGVWPTHWMPLPEPPSEVD